MKDAKDIIKKKLEKEESEALEKQLRVKILREMLTEFEGQTTSVPINQPKLPISSSPFASKGLDKAILSMLESGEPITTPQIKKLLPEQYNIHVKSTSIFDCLRRMLRKEKIVRVKAPIKSNCTWAYQKA